MDAIGALAMAHKGGPFADAVCGQDRCPPWAQSERPRSRMRLVVLGEQDLAPRYARCDEMMPRAHTFSPSEFFMACGKDLHDSGNARVWK